MACITNVGRINNITYSSNIELDPCGMRVRSMLFI